MVIWASIPRLPDPPPWAHHVCEILKRGLPGKAKEALTEVANYQGRRVS